MRPLLMGLVLAVLLVGAWGASGDIPAVLSYQGVLKTSTGDPVPDGMYDVTFRIYDVEAGGTALWTETQTVSVADGIMNAYLGDAVSLTTLDFDAPYWLGISVGADAELAPRTRLATVPYAARAVFAIEADDDWEIDGDNVYHQDGNVGIGTNFMDSRLEVAAGDARGIDVENASGTTNFAIRALNQVGTAGAFYSGTTASGYPGTPTAVYGAAGGTGQGGFFVARDDGTGLTAQSQGSGPALRGWAFGTGYSGYFTGGQGVFVDGPIKVGGFTMSTGASPGYVLTSDASGVGTWQASTGGIGGGGTANYLAKFTGASSIGNSTLYETAIGVGLGTTSPSAKLDVSSSSYPAIEAEYVGTSHFTEAVHGVSVRDGDYGTGGFFEGGAVGVRGEVTPVSGDVSPGYHGVEGQVYGDATEDVMGVLGHASGDATVIGVYGRATGPLASNYGIYGSAAYGSTNYAVYSWGDCHVTGTLTKGAGAFQIDHPLDPGNKYLRHSFVESPDMKNVYDGVVVLDASGGAWIELPEWFEALNEDFRYQLTPIGAPGPNLYIAEEIAGNSFRIAGGDPGMKVSWQVTGIRHDKYAEAHRIVVEEAKHPEDLGKYSHPELYGRSIDEAIGYVAPPESTQREGRGTMSAEARIRDGSDGE